MRVDFDGAPLRRIANCIREQVREHLLHPSLVREDGEALRSGDADRVPLAERLHARAHVLEERAEIELRGLDLERSGLQAARLEQVPHQPVQPIDLLGDETQRPRRAGVSPLLAHLV